MHGQQNLKKPEEGNTTLLRNAGNFKKSTWLSFQNISLHPQDLVKRLMRYSSNGLA